MTEQDWQRIRRDTERAIEEMKRAIRIAEVGKKRNVTSKVTSTSGDVTRK